jgi:hypothetical protein
MSSVASRVRNGIEGSQALGRLPPADRAVDDLLEAPGSGDEQQARDKRLRHRGFRMHPACDVVAVRRREDRGRVVGQAQDALVHALVEPGRRQRGGRLRVALVDGARQDPPEEIAVAPVRGVGDPGECAALVDAILLGCEDRGVGVG